MENSNKPSSSNMQDVAQSPEKKNPDNKSAKKKSPLKAASNQASKDYLYLRSAKEEFELEDYANNNFSMKSPHPTIAPTLVLVNYNLRLSSTVNLSAVDTILLTLMTPRKLDNLDMDAKVRTAVEELRPFRSILNQKLWLCTGRRSQGSSHSSMKLYMKAIPESYLGQLALMAWFIYLASQMTSNMDQPRDAICHALMDMETLADAMAVKKSWAWPQYAILKEMYLDLKRMHYSFRVNRDETSGKFRPMSEVDGPKGSKGVGGSKHHNHHRHH